MTKQSRTLHRALAGAIGVCIATGGVLAGQQYRALENVNSVKVVFDIRTGDAARAASSLTLINSMLRDESLTAVSERPEFALVFSGGSVKLLSRNMEGYSPEDRQLKEQIAELAAALKSRGVSLEACLIAAARFEVDPDSFVPAIDPVGNGWVSLIGYQAKEHSLVAIY